MSGRLMSVVLASALASWLKPFATALASFATEEGDQVFPSVARVAQMAGRSERQARRAMRALRGLGVIVRVARAHQRAAWQYRFNAGALPQVGDPVQPELFAQAQLASTPRGARTFPLFHRRQQDMGVTLPLTPMSPDPSIDPPITSTHQRARARMANAQKIGS